MKYGRLFFMLIALVACSKKKEKITDIEYGESAMASEMYVDSLGEFKMNFPGDVDESWSDMSGDAHRVFLRHTDVYYDIDYQITALYYDTTVTRELFEEMVTSNEKKSDLEVRSSGKYFTFKNHYAYRKTGESSVDPGERAYLGQELYVMHRNIILAATVYYYPEYEYDRNFFSSITFADSAQFKPTEIKTFDEEE